MAIFHLTAKVISRGKGQSAVAAAAYRSGDKLFDQQAGEEKAYNSRSERIAFTDIMAPADAPEWVHDRNTLWNMAERAEKRKDAQLAREIEIALPHELTARQREWLVKDFAREAFVRKGYAVDIAIHAPDRDSDGRNHHAHLMITRRTVGPDGFAPTKDWQFDKTQLERWREQWEHLANRHLERHGHEARIDRRSLKEQGIDREPTFHVGYAANEMTQRGAPSDRMTAFNELLARNELRFDLQTIGAQLAGLEKQLAAAQKKDAVQAQQSLSDNGQHRALAAAWASRRRHDAAAQIARSQSAAPAPTPEPKRQRAKPVARPMPLPQRVPASQPQKAKPVARAAMEQKPEERQQPQQQPRPEIAQQAKPVEQLKTEQANASVFDPRVLPDAGMLQRSGWRYDETWGWEKIEDAVARKGREERPAPARDAQTSVSKEPDRAKAAEQAAKARAAEPVPAARPPQENARTDTRSATPQPPASSPLRTGITYQHTPEAESYLTPIEHINAAHHAAEQAAAKAREEQQRKKDMADLARAARADDAKMRDPTPSLHGIFGAKVADAIREDAQKIRAQVREERQEQTQANWQKWAQAQNPDRVTPREVAGRAAQAGKQAMRSSFRVVNRATGAVSSLGDFVGNLLSLSPANPPVQSNRFSSHTIATDPEARKQYQLAQRDEARRRNLDVAVIEDIRRDVEAGRDLKAEDISKLSRDHLENIASKGDAYVREMIESARKRSEEYWRGSRERNQD